MAGINSTIRINDAMSPALKSMNKALNIVLNSFEKLQSVSGSAVDTADIVDARNELNNAAVAVNRLEEELRQAGNQQEQFTREVKSSENAMSGLVKQAAGLIATYASFQTLMGAVNLSDKMSQTSSRLSLIVDVDEGASRAEIDKAVAEMEDKIFASANRSRSSFLDTASAVAAFAQRAGDAFSGNDEVIAFAETLNKMYVIAGATAEEQSSSMLQLTQALGSGVLRGEEFNAVFEAAPNIMQAVADYMEIPIGKLRDMASEGQITADVVKNAIFNATESVNEDFENMQWTWAQVWTSFQNYATQAFDPVLTKISELANNEDVQNFAIGVGNAMANVANVILWVFELVASLGSFMYQNWSLLSPVIYGVAAALAVYYGAQMIANAVSAITTGIHYAMAAAKMVQLAVSGGLTAATAAETAAQWGLNAALYACPLVWILILIIAVIAIIYLVVAAINKVTGSSVSATGIIAGAIMVAVAFIWNIIYGLISFIVGIGVELYNLIAVFANFFANVFNDPVGAIIGLFSGLFDFILGIVQAAASLIDSLLGTDMASAVEGFRNTVADKTAELVGEQKVVMEKTSQEEVMASLGMSRMEYGGAWDAGYSFGEGVDDKLSNLSLDSLLGSAGSTDALEGIGSGVGDIADYTGSMADSMEMSEEDLKYLRDIAEQDVINRFTTAEIKIDMQNNNNINSNMDIDGIVTQLEDKLYESMEIAAEGVH